ncbi:class II fumarate hydratase [Aerococcus mictus]|uniref:class II fumarate hydratase n=1 Tax=Aerococcus mictus TaxID=2976810 RepID=UPI000DCF359B|nr:class II fumarate hydratase [Aerococcus mictus]KAA9233687.1 class II fumarate hydratase [Aerococcus mictus]MDL5184452.1 class II fumarate hydratase [Aerococcus mictus]
MTEEFRIEHDSMGEIKVPAEHYWGAVTQRSKQNFLIGTELMPEMVLRPLINIKKAEAQANRDIDNLDAKKAEYIVKAADKALALEDIHSEFPLRVWQTGSGTQTNMNANEVLANIGNELAGEKLLHPNDDVNKGQSSNDVFPAAMQIGFYEGIHSEVIPAVDRFIETLQKLEDKYKDKIKVGRTHLQDATPVTFGQEVSGWKTMMIKDKQMIEESSAHLLELPLGGTATGTGLNCPEGLDVKACQYLADNYGHDYTAAENKFYGMTSKGQMSQAHAALRTLAEDMLKVANDVRFLASGPRCGIGELIIPSNEPGSSIMPGKVNPTQAEAMTMVSTQVMGNDQVIAIAASQGYFELNTYMPLIINNCAQSVSLLGTAIDSFNHMCVAGIEVDHEKMDHYLEISLMNVTKLSPVIGYEKAAEIAKHAHKNKQSLKEASHDLGYLDDEEFDKIMRFEDMV